MSLFRDDNQTPHPTDLSVVETALFLSISPNDVEHGLEEGALWSEQRGKEVRIPLESCFEWLLTLNENRFLGANCAHSAPECDLDPRELRISRRFRVNLPANLCTFDGVSRPVIVTDISHGGALVTGFTGKDSVPIEFQLSFLDGPLVNSRAFTCQLVHLRWECDETLTLGCRFTDVSSPSAEDAPRT